MNIFQATHNGAGKYLRINLCGLYINGIYNTDENVQGTWPLYAHKYGVLIVLCSKSYGAAQFYISDGTENVYVRKSYNLGKTWEKWLLIKGVDIA